MPGALSHALCARAQHQAHNVGISVDELYVPWLSLPRFASIIAYVKTPGKITPHLRPALHTGYIQSRLVVALINPRSYVVNHKNYSKVPMYQPETLLIAKNRQLKQQTWLKGNGMMVLDGPTVHKVISLKLEHDNSARRVKGVDCMLQAPMCDQSLQRGAL